MRCEVYSLLPLLRSLPISTLFREKRYGNLPRTVFNFLGTEKETLIYLQRTADADVHLEHDKWEFHIYNDACERNLTLLLDFKT